MIAFVRGILNARTESSVIVDAGGLGFEIFVPLSVQDRLPAIGDEVTLHTYMNVKEDGMSLYGFLNRDDLSMVY